MNYLFFIVHPSKYYFFRDVINRLIENGHKVDLLIISKGGLEELVKSEKWNYANIFPNGRRIKGLHIYISSFINLFVTLIKLRKFTKRKNYDLFLTDDLLTLIGHMRNVPSIFCTDDDIEAVPESVILIKTANYLLSPEASYMGKYEYKKIGYKGFKSLAHLHPAHFVPDRSLLDDIIVKAENYFLIRCVSVTSTHDVGKKGITDALLIKLVEFLNKYGKVIISSERALPSEVEPYRIVFQNNCTAHCISFAKIFIGDSTTMCSEAAVLGTPSIEIDDWYSDFGQYKILNGKYELIWGYKPTDEISIFNKISEMLSNGNLGLEYLEKRNKMINDTIDVSSFIHWLISNYPSSVKEYFMNNDIQLRFK